jgi:hypothetical protein
MPKAPTPPIKDIVISSRDPELVQILKDIKQTIEIREGRLGDSCFRFIDYCELVELLAGDETITVTVLPAAHTHNHADLTGLHQGVDTGDSPTFASLTIVGAIGAASLTVLGALAANNLHLSAGATVDTIEPAVTNDATHIPTSAAVYAAIAGLSFDKISEGNSSVEVIDAGVGRVDITVDGTLALRMLAGRMQLPIGLLETDTSAPKDLEIDCGSQKTVKIKQSVWDDLRIVPGAFKFAGSADPSLQNWQPGGSGATFKVYKFKKNDEAFASCQMPHTYKEGTDLEFHIHWTPANRGVAESGNKVGWKVDYTIAVVGGIFGASATVDLSDTCSGVNDKHELAGSVTVSGAGLKVSHIIVLRIYRTDTGTDDTWAGTTNAQSPALLEFDIHFRKDTMGSRQEFIK